MLMGYALQLTGSLQTIMCWFFDMLDPDPYREMIIWVLRDHS